MKRKIKIPFYVPAALLFILLVAVMYFQPKSIDWSLSWSKDAKRPYGSKHLYSMLENYFKVDEIHVIEEPLKTMKNWPTEKTHYLALGNTVLGHTKRDIEYIKKFANTGGSVFISSNSYSTDFLDSLGIKVNYNYVTDNLSNEVEINFTDPEIKALVPYKSNVEYSALYFDSIPSNAIVLVRDLQKNPKTIVMPFGKGNLFLNTTPIFFTNYHLFNNNDVDFIEKSFSYLGDAESIYWDEFFKVDRSAGNTPIQVLLSHKGFKLSWFLLLGLIALYILFMSKRKRKAIPIILPLQNTSVEFTKTIGQLYFNQQNHANLAQKISSLFLEQIRQKYHLMTDVLDDNFMAVFSEKSGFDKVKTEKLVYTLKRATTGEIKTEKELQNLHHLIEEFKKTIE